MALDDRTSKEDEARVRSLADKVFLWESQGYCELAYRFVQRCSSDFVLMVADDEEPSEMCWDFAQTPPFPARFGIPIIPIKGRKVWTYDVGVSDRLLHRRGWRWIGGFEGHSEGARMVTMSDNPGVLIWHYLLDAPRDERVAKAARYTIASGRPETDKDNLRRMASHGVWVSEHSSLRSTEFIEGALKDRFENSMHVDLLANLVRWAAGEGPFSI